MNWIERLAGAFARTKAPAVKSGSGGLIALHLQGQPRWSARNYGALAREGYMRNPVVHRAVRMIAENAATVPWLLYEGDVELETHPLLTLLGAPNPHESGVVMFETLYAYLQLSGNAFLEAVGEGEVSALYALRPDRMTAVGGADGWPEAYAYQVDGQVVRYLQTGEHSEQPILHLKLFHPLDDHGGLPPLEAAAAALDLHNAGSAWNKALLDNGARPSGALIYQGANGEPNLSDAQFERLKGELEREYQGAANAGRPLVLEGGLSWSAMSLSPQDMDFINARHIAAREIALAFGVPPMLLGIPGDNTYANYREANLAFWRQTVIPLVAKLKDALSAWLLPRFGEGLRLAVDLDAVPALASEREAVWSMLNAATFLDEDEKRAAVGYGRKA